MRELRTPEEYRACEALQRLTWGDDFDLVPSHLVKVSQRLGGVGAGAFDDAGTLLGFVFGLTGVDGGVLVHWSDVLAVVPEARGRGIGRLLKEHQREVVRGVGVRVIRWTFDPLVARNAYLNLARLGARVDEYAPDMYDESPSPLHRGLGMDRLVVSWDLFPEDTSGQRGNRVTQGAAAAAPVVNVGEEGTPRARPSLPSDAPALRIRIPLDIHHVRDTSPELARTWRESTRAAFLEAFARGYSVTGFRDGCYLLARVVDRQAV